MKNQIYLALGSNAAGRWGSSTDTLERALQALGSTGLRITARSRLYGTRPTGARGQSDYLNCVVAARTTLSPRAVLARIKAIERRAGRRGHTARWTARTLDIDMIDYAGLVRGRPRHQTIGSLILPHPQMHKRPFVVIPLADVAPRWRHPRSGQSISQLVWRVMRQKAGQIIAVADDLKPTS